MKEICKNQAKASVIEDQLQALAATILEPVEELKPMHVELRSLVKKNASCESIETLNLNQSVILSELKKFTNNDNENTGWIAKIVENLKKVKPLISLQSKSLFQQASLFVHMFIPQIHCGPRPACGLGVDLLHSLRGAQGSFR